MHWKPWHLPETHIFEKFLSIDRHLALQTQLQFLYTCIWYALETMTSAWNPHPWKVPIDRSVSCAPNAATVSYTFIWYALETMTSAWNHIVEKFLSVRKLRSSAGFHIRVPIDRSHNLCTVKGRQKFLFEIYIHIYAWWSFLSVVFHCPRDATAATWALRSHPTILRWWKNRSQCSLYIVRLPSSHLSQGAVSHHARKETKFIVQHSIC